LETAYFLSGVLDNIVIGDNPKLKRLMVNGNDLSAQTLNALFESLHANDITDKTVVILKNPGANTCNKSIAEKKGWKVEWN
jgi:hypothetical protein